MQVTVGEIRKIILEEVAQLKQRHLDEVVPFKGVADVSAGRDRRPFRYRYDVNYGPGEYDPDEDMIVPGDIHLEPTDLENARNALTQALRAVNAFNPRWHRWACQTSQGQEMSDIVIDLERALKVLARELNAISEAFVLDPISLRMIAEEESRRQDEAGIFKGVADIITGRGRSPRRIRRNVVNRKKVPAQDVRKISPAIARVRTLISDMITLYDTFTPKFRRRMCLGQEGENLILRLQTLDDMLDKL